MTTYALTEGRALLRSDGVSIPADPANADYQAYQAWRAKGNTPTPYVAPVVVPYSVTPFQAKAALFAAGLLPAVEAAIAAAPKIAQLAYSDATEFTRDSPTIAELSAQLGLTSAQIDALFTAAAAIEA